MNTANQGQSQNKQQDVGFTVVEQKIHCPYRFQFYIDYGTDPYGPWLKVGIADTEYGVGFLPQPVAPSLKVATT
jgi:hypothetical protein